MMPMTVKAAAMVAAGLLVSIVAHVHTVRADIACRRVARDWLTANAWHCRPAATLQPDDLDMR